jgi:hypothetical protein
MLLGKHSGNAPRKFCALSLIRLMQRQNQYTY